MNSKKYIIYDVKNGTYLAPGTRRNFNGTYGPSWTAYRTEAIKFNTVQEAKLTLRRVKNDKNQDNKACIYISY